MKDEQHNSGPDQSSAEPELSDYQRQAERLAFENRMLRTVLDSMPDNISIKDLKGRYIFDNSGHSRFLGATNTAEVVGKTVFDFLPTAIASKFHAEDLRTLVEDSRAHATEPAKFLQELNRGISHILKRTRLEIFVSACYLMADVARGELSYANAGHPTPLCVRRARRSAEPLLVRGSKPEPVLGIFDDAEYPVGEFQRSLGNRG
jgi:PAS domain-containing protein